MLILAWADQLLPKESMGRTSSSSTHSPSKEGAGPSARPTATPRTRPLQRHGSPLNSPSETVTPRSRRRLDDIQAGLEQREHDFSPTRRPGPSKEPGPGTPLSTIVPTIPQPPSPVPTEVDSDEVEAQPRKTYSFLGLYDSPESVVSAIKDEGEPSTPKKRRVTTDPAPPGEGLLLTPPQSRQRTTKSDQPELLSTTRRSGKGKEREGAPPVQTQGQVGAHCFHCQ